jgi:hypothetical protein
MYLSSIDSMHNLIYISKELVILWFQIEHLNNCLDILLSIMTKEPFIRRSFSVLIYLFNLLR